MTDPVGPVRLAPTAQHEPAGYVEVDDAVPVLPGALELALGGEPTCDWRDGDVW